MAVAQRAVAPLAARKPIEFAEANAEPRALKVEKGSALMRNIEASSATTEALLHQLDVARAPVGATAEARGLGPKARQRKLASHPASGQTRSAKGPRAGAPTRAELS